MRDRPRLDSESARRNSDGEEGVEPLVPGGRLKAFSCTQDAGQRHCTLPLLVSAEAFGQIGREIVPRDAEMSRSRRGDVTPPIGAGGVGVVDEEALARIKGRVEQDCLAPARAEHVEVQAQMGVVEPLASERALACALDAHQEDHFHTESVAVG